MDNKLTLKTGSGRQNPPPYWKCDKIMHCGHSAHTTCVNSKQ